MNILSIVNPNTFDEEVWQTTTDFNQEQYNTWLKNATETLQDIYDSYTGNADIYVLGDIINMLNHTTIQVKGKH